MESLDVALTYAIDLTMALGAGYIGTAFVIYMIDRWKEIEVKPKLKQSQKVKIPLNLKAVDAIPLELEQQDLSVAAIPLEPIVTPAPERQEVRTIEPVTEKPEILSAPEIPESKLNESAEEPDVLAPEIPESELVESAEEPEIAAPESSEPKLNESAEEPEALSASEIPEPELVESAEEPEALPTLKPKPQRIEPEDSESEMDETL